MPGLQEWIHKLEEGEGTRYIKIGTLILVLLAVTVIYDVREFRNFSTQEAMDKAQLARNIAQGRGYTTRFIRPLSVHLIKEHRKGEFPSIKAEHPDLANAPVYPLVLAVFMKVMPFNYKITDSANFMKCQPEILIAGFNQALFFAAALMIFCLARKLFDASVGWVSALVFLASDLFWRFSVSGLPTMLLVVIFLGVVWCLVALEQGSQVPVPNEAGSPQTPAPETKRSVLWFIMVAVAAGALVGVGGLTLYSFAWLILPTVAFLAFYFPQRRPHLPLAALIAFILVMAPWVVRNYQKSGTLFGTAGFSIYQETLNFRDNRLERSLVPDLDKVTTRQIFYKLVENAGDIASNQLPRMGGSWVSAFFLVGLLVQFRSSTLSRLRVFLLVSLVLLTLVQALGRTHLTTASPEVNTENILAILAPLVFMFGVSLYFVLLDQVTLPFAEARYLVTGTFVVTAGVSLIITLLPPRSNPIVYPPYYPPATQEISEMLEEKELMISDMPWAVAWYGDRQCLWLTLKSPLKPPNDFFEIYTFEKTIKALYLTPLTMDKQFRAQMLLNDDDWGKFIMQVLLKAEVPPQFPLKKFHAGFFPFQFVLMDRERWKTHAK